MERLSGALQLAAGWVKRAAIGGIRSSAAIGEQRGRFWGTAVGEFIITGHDMGSAAPVFSVVVPVFRGKWHLSDRDLIACRAAKYVRFVCFGCWSVWRVRAEVFPGTVPACCQLTAGRKVEECPFDSTGRRIGQWISGGALLESVS